MARKLVGTTAPRTAHVVISEEAHAEIRMIAAREGIPCGLVVEDLLRLRREAQKNESE